MSKVARDPERLWSENCEDVGYALGKNIIMYMLFEKEREKEIERVWKSRMEPFDDEFKLKFIEDGDEYAFVIYRKHPGEESSIWLCRAGLEANGHYTNFKRSLQDELLFTYGLSGGRGSGYLKDTKSSATYNSLKDRRSTRALISGNF